MILKRLEASKSDTCKSEEVRDPATLCCVMLYQRVSDCVDVFMQVSGVLTSLDFFR